MGGRRSAPRAEDQRGLFDHHQATPAAKGSTKIGAACSSASVKAPMAAHTNTPMASASACKVRVNSSMLAF